MISTLTMSAISTLRTGAWVDTLAAIGLVILFALLLQKELASVAGIRYRYFVKILNVAIAPLLIAFILIVGVKVIDVIF